MRGEDDAERFEGQKVTNRHEREEHKPDAESFARPEVTLASGVAHFNDLGTNKSRHFHLRTCA